MIGAPVLLLASTMVYAAGGGINNDRAGGIIQVYAFAAWILVVMGLTQILEVPFPRASAGLTLIGALGVAGGIAYGIDSIHVAATGVSAEDLGAAGPLALNIPGLLFPLSHIGIGVGLLRANVQPRWSGIVLIMAAILFPASRIPAVAALAIAGDAAFLLALAPLGWATLQGRDLIQSSD
jgi:hypothetical protein